MRNFSVSIGLIHPQPQTPVEAPGKISDELEMLHSLGYVDSTYDPKFDESGVMFIDESRVFRGPRLYSSVTSNEARLIDDRGNVLHTWSYPSGGIWTFVRLLDDGDLLVIVRDRSLIRLGRDSELKWTLPIRPHHDLDVWNDTIYVLTREESRRENLNRHHRIAEDFVSLVSLDGEPLSKIPLLDLFESSEYRFLLRSVNDIKDETSDTEKDRPLCLLHANHVEVIDGTENWPFGDGMSPQILVSLRNVNVLMTFELKSHEITWIWGPNNLVYPHDPSLLDTGNILLFDNGLEHSEVLEIDPENFDIVWRYAADDFFSKTRGSAQRLPNGNTLVTESNEGRIFEVTADGDLVWNFKNPDVTDNGMRSAVFRMTALEETPTWLQ